MKTYIAFLLLIFCSASWNLHGQVLGTVIESWDFNGGLPSNWTSGSTTPLAHWEYRGPSTNPSINICSRGSCGTGTVPIQSNTQSNGFMIFDSNYWDDAGTTCGNIGTGSDPAPHTAWMITNSINLSSAPNVYITFQQQLRNYSGSCSVQYSTDNGTTWQTIPSLTQTGVITTPSVQWKSANIGSLVGGNSNVKFKFLFDGFYYHWCLDDITIYQPSFNNVEVTKPQYTLYNEMVNPLNNMMYDQYPSFLAPTVTPNCIINNLGINTQNNVVLQNKIFKINAGTQIYDNSTAGVDITNGNSVNASNPNQVISVSIEDYIVTFGVTQNQVDEDMSNNMDTLDFSIHPYTYARDEGPADNIYNNNVIYPNTTTTEVGAIYKFPFNNLKKIFSMQVGIGEGTLPGTVIQGFLYVPTMDSILATTLPYTVNIADINGIGEEKMITLPLVTPLAINAATIDYPDIVLDTITNETMPNPFIGSIAAMVRNMSPGQPFFIARSGEAPANTTYLHFPDQQDLYYLLRIPQVRLNLFNSTQIPGCTVDSAANYNPLANIDDGSCDYAGCTQEQYDNYNPAWNWDDGSCTYIGCLDPAADNYSPQATQIVNCIYSGCMDPTAANFDPIANLADSSCLYNGCTDSLADNFNPQANQDDGSCFYLGCNDPLAYNYDSTATSNDGTCVYEGCTDSIAQNYNPIATIENGSCIYPGCMDNAADNFDANATVDDGSCFYLGCTNASATNFDPSATVDDGSCLFLGCTDVNADNFNPTANVDDGSCFYLGCTNVNADNYDSTATVDDGSCYFLGCTDANANNFDPIATIDDGSCQYYGCTDNTAINFDPNANFNDGSCMYLIASLFSAVTEGCNPLTITVMNQTISYPESTCEFVFSNGDTIYNCSPSFDYTFDSAGTYSITYNYYYDIFPSSATLNNIQVHAVPETPNIVENTGNFACSNCIAGINYQWLLDGTPIPNSTNVTFNNLAPNHLLSGNFQLVATNAFGCSDTSSNMMIVQPNFSIADNSLCLDETVSVNINPLNVLNVNCSLDWGDGTIENATSSTVFHNYSLEGQYTIELICYHNLDTGNFISSVSIHPVPQSPIIQFNNPEFTITNADSGVNYQWINNQVNLANQTDTLLSIYFNGIFNNGWYLVNGLNSFGCSAHSDSIFIAQPYFDLNADSLCPNLVVYMNNLTDMEVPMVCNTNWGDGIMNDLLDHTYNVAGNYNVIMTCSAFGQSFEYVDSILVLPSPLIPTITYNFPDITISNFNPIENYQWYYNQNPISPNGSNTLSIFSNNTYQNGWYSISTTNIHNCTSISDSIAVLQPYFSLTDPTICPGEIMELNQLTLPWNSNCTVQWGDGYVEVITSNSISHIYSDTATYSIQMTCNNPYTSGEYQTTITMNPIPVTPTIQYNIGVVSCLNVNPNEIHQWFYNQNALLGENGAQHFNFNGVNYDNGWYQFSATNEYNCTSFSDSIYVIQPVVLLDNNLVCSSDSILIQNITQNLSDFTCSIQWGDGSVTTNNQEWNTHLYTFGSEYAISMVCFNNWSSGYILDTISILTSPSIPDIYYSQPNVLCTNCPSNLSYDWNLWNNDITNATNGIWNIWNGTNYSNGPYQLNIQGVNGCTSSSDTLWVIQPYFSLNSDSICQLDTITFSNLTDGMSWLTCSIQWGDGNTDTWTMDPTTHIYNADGSMNIDLQCTDNLHSGIYQESAFIISTPQPILQESNNIVSCTNGLSEWITTWEIDNVMQPQFNNTLSLSADLGLEYWMTATTTEGCHGTGYVMTDYVAPHVEEINTTLQIFPNPATSFIQIEGSTHSFNGTIFNQEGKRVLSFQSQSNIHKIELDGFAPGSYTIIIQEEEKEKTAQFLISR